MRRTIRITIAAVLLAGCGDDLGLEPDATELNQIEEAPATERAPAYGCPWGLRGLEWRTVDLTVEAWGEEDHPICLDDMWIEGSEILTTSIPCGEDGLHHVQFRLPVDLYAADLEILAEPPLHLSRVVIIPGVTELYRIVSQQ